LSQNIARDIHRILPDIFTKYCQRFSQNIAKYCHKNLQRFSQILANIVNKYCQEDVHKMAKDFHKNCTKNCQRLLRKLKRLSENDLPSSLALPTVNHVTKLFVVQLVVTADVKLGKGGFNLKRQRLIVWKFNI
jgi:hypothetical protein